MIPQNPHTRKMHRFYRGKVLVAQVTEEDFRMCPDFWAKAVSDTCDAHETAWVGMGEKSEVFHPEVDDLVEPKVFYLKAQPRYTNGSSRASAYVAIIPNVNGVFDRAVRYTVV